MSDINKNNILIITVRADFGGGPEHIFQLVNQLKNDFNFFFACPKDYPYFELYTKLVGSKNIFTIPHREIRVESLLYLSSFIRKNKIKLIHSHGKGAGIYSRSLFFLSRIPVVHTFHGIHIEQYSSVAKVFYLILERFFSLLTRKFISVSNSEKEKILNNKIVDENKIALIPNGVNIPKNIKSDFSEELNILFITRDDPQKNNDAAVKIAKLISSDARIMKTTLNIIGSGLESLAASDGTGLIKIHEPQTNLSDYFSDADFYINTSLAEGLSLSILEAMAHGLPIIASRVTGNVDIVKDNVNGFLFDLDKPNEVVAKVVECKLNKNLYQNISTNNINLIKGNYSVQLMAEKTKNVYREVLNDK